MTGTNLGANVARVTDPAKSNKEGALPSDIQSDLRDSFEYFCVDGENLINRSAFESIIHNFGFSHFAS